MTVALRRLGVKCPKHADARGHDTRKHIDGRYHIEGATEPKINESTRIAPNDEFQATCDHLRVPIHSAKRDPYLESLSKRLVVSRPDQRGSFEERTTTYLHFLFYSRSVVTSPSRRARCQNRCL